MSRQVFVGLDLGQKQDHSAIAVVERLEQRLAWMPSLPPRCASVTWNGFR